MIDPEKPEVIVVEEDAQTATMVWPAGHPNAGQPVPIVGGVPIVDTHTFKAFPIKTLVVKVYDGVARYISHVCDVSEAQLKTLSKGEKEILASQKLTDIRKKEQADGKTEPTK